MNSENLMVGAKKIAVMQPYFLPYIGYFQLISAVDSFVIFDDVNYINRGWINRNRILLDGKDHMITLPLSQASQNKLINEISLAPDSLLARKKILTQINHGYKKSEYFSDFYPILSNIILNEEADLVKYLVNSLRLVCDYIGIKSEFILSSEIKKNNQSNGQEKIIEICHSLSANRYLNLIGGLELYDKNVFLENRIDLKFISTNPIEYRQFSENFIPYLSIIDLLMFNSKQRVKEFTENYALA